MPSIYSFTEIQKDSISLLVEKFQFEILSLNHISSKKKITLNSDILSNFKIILVHQGDFMIHYRTSQYHIQTGDMLLIPPFVFYTVVCHGQQPLDFYTFHFDLVSLPMKHSFTEAFHLHSLNIYPQLLQPQVFHFVEQTYLKIKGNEVGAYFSGKILLYQLLLSIFQQVVPATMQSATHGQDNESKVVMDCINYLDLHLTDCLQVSDLCQLVNVSQSYLYQCFIKCTNQSTKDFMVSYKLKKIEFELKQGNHSIKEIVDKYNYGSVYAFSNLFKKYYGLSPLKFRKRNALKNTYITLLPVKTEQN